eukprot:scaffold446994_cov23-Prasinocladus_malaysianus.AAC.1
MSISTHIPNGEAQVSAGYWLCVRILSRSAMHPGTFDHCALIEGTSLLEYYGFPTQVQSV